MASRFHLYGSQGHSLKATAHAVSDALDVDLELRESSYKGGEYYYGATTEGFKVTVENNWEDEEGELVEPEWPSFKILIYTEMLTADGERTMSAVPHVTPLRIEEL